MLLGDLVKLGVGVPVSENGLVNVGREILPVKLAVISCDGVNVADVSYVNVRLIVRVSLLKVTSWDGRLADREGRVTVTVREMVCFSMPVLETPCDSVSEKSGVKVSERDVVPVNDAMRVADFVTDKVSDGKDRVTSGVKVMV
jgi:hypothetical protein